MGLLLSKLSSLHHAVQSLCGAASTAELSPRPCFILCPARVTAWRTFHLDPSASRLHRQLVYPGLYLGKCASTCVSKSLGQDVSFMEENIKEEKVILATRIYMESA